MYHPRIILGGTNANFTSLRSTRFDGMNSTALRTHGLLTRKPATPGVARQLMWKRDNQGFPRRQPFYSVKKEGLTTDEYFDPMG